MFPAIPLSDILYLLQWWFLLFLTGLAFLPLTVFFFSLFVDKGYAFSKILGTIVVSYIVFVLGTMKLVPFTSLTIYAVVLLSCLLLYKANHRFAAPVGTLFRQRWRLLFVEELLFLFGLCFWSIIRGYNPEIYGLEKYMDFGFVNSILRAEYFPPKDMWFTPLSINYYYFGHFITAVLTKASHIPSFITYNIMLGTLFGLCFTHVFSFATTLWSILMSSQTKEHVSKLMKKSLYGIGVLAGLLVTISGNLHILYAFFKSYGDKPVPLWELEFLPLTFPNGYWYPNATRFIYNTIHEFPIYSWVVADLHGHVADIPIVLFTVAFIFSLFLHFNNHATTIKKMTFLLSIGFLMAVMYMTNAWDGMIYFLLTGITLLFIEWQRVMDDRQHRTSHNLLLRLPLKHSLIQKSKHFLHTFWLLDWIIGVGLYTVIIGISFILFSLPFSIHFKPFVSGIGVLCAPKFLTDKGSFGPLLFEADHCQKSPWWQLLTLYGFFYFFVLIFLAFISKARKLSPSDIYVTVLIILSSLLIIIPEFIYVKDIYPAHYRANTMFKLVFQAFMLLSICSAYIIMRSVVHMKQYATSVGKKIFVLGYSLFIVFLLSLVLTYPILATQSYYGNLITYKGLDGQKYLQNIHPADYEAVQWLNTNVKGQPVILEAQGDSYTDYARISTNTGLPTVLGWTVHEWLWRGTYDIPAPRITEIQTMYESSDKEAVRQLLKKYNVKYVYVGDLERQKYLGLHEGKFADLGKKVFSMNGTSIYELKL